MATNDVAEQGAAPDASGCAAVAGELSDVRRRTVRGEGVNWAGMPVWGSLLIILLIAESAKVFLIRRLRTQHPYLWEEIGQPSYFSNTSFDLLGKLTPYRHDTEDPVSRDRQVQNLVILRRVSWWLVYITVVGLSLSGLGNLLSIYKTTEPRPAVAAAAAVAMVAIIVLSLKARRRRE